jgi:hypothetical protein
MITPYPFAHLSKNMNRRAGLSSYLAAAFLAASLSISHAPLFKDDEKDETEQQMKERTEGGKDQVMIQINSKLSHAHGLRFFTLGEIGVWALNIKNAQRKFKQLNLC